MPLLTMNDIRTIQGFEALTQGETRLELMLLGNINDLKGKKAMGFIKTRSEVVKGEFDRTACRDFILLSSFLEKDSLMAKENVLPKYKGKSLCERICRDHVPLDMVATFGVLAKMILTMTGCLDTAVSIVERYLTEGKIQPIAEYYRQAEKCIKKGLVMSINGSLQTA